MMSLLLTTYGKVPIITVGESSRWHWASPALIQQQGESMFPLATATWTCSYQACFLDNYSLHPVYQVKRMWHYMGCHGHTVCHDYVHHIMMLYGSIGNTLNAVFPQIVTRTFIYLNCRRYQTFIWSKLLLEARLYF